MPAPDAADLLCDAHRLPLLPPHLEAFLNGSSPQLLVGGTTATGSSMEGTNPPSAASLSLEASSTVADSPSASNPGLVPGQAPDAGSLEALRAAGLSASEVGMQLSAMRHLERRSSTASASSSSLTATLPPTNNELLDRENHSVVEILTKEEFMALEKWWPDTTVFSLSFTVDAVGNTSFGGEPPCRECDASGREYEMSIKNRARGWVKKSSEKTRAPASLEY